jgi:GMP synthase PP-ATPase subunit
MSANPLLDLLADKVAQLGRTLTSSEPAGWVEPLRNPSIAIAAIGFASHLCLSKLRRTRSAQPILRADLQRVPTVSRQR